MKSCHFCITNKCGLQFALDEAMREWGIKKSTPNMVRCARAGKAMENWVLG